MTKKYILCKMLTRVNKGVYMISKRAEEYLKTMYVLNKQNGEIRVTDIANKMNCSKPCVTKQLNILSKNKLINYETYGEITLTSLGEEIAKKTLADCDILYIFLNDVIGLPKELSSIESSNIKSVISDKTLEGISSYVNNMLGINKLNCNFDIRNEKCRNCIKKGSIS